MPEFQAGERVAHQEKMVDKTSNSNSEFILFKTEDLGRGNWHVRGSRLKVKFQVIIR